MDLGPSPVHLQSISPSNINITRAEKRQCGFRSLARLPAVKVAYQGEPGAYSEQAVLSLFPSAEPLPCDTVRLVFSRVTSGEADVGRCACGELAGRLRERDLRSPVAQQPGEGVRRGRRSGGSRPARREGRPPRGHPPRLFPLAGAGAERGVPRVAARRDASRSRHGRGRSDDRRARRPGGGGGREHRGGKQVRPEGAGRADPDLPRQLHEVRRHRDRRSRASGHPTRRPS